MIKILFLFRSVSDRRTSGADEVGAVDAISVFPEAQEFPGILILRKKVLRLVLHVLFNLLYFFNDRNCIITVC